MNEVVDLSFVDSLENILARRNQYADVLREGLRHKLKHLHDDGEQSIDYARGLLMAGGDATEELNEMEAFGLSLQLMVRLLRHEAARRAENPTEFWQAAE